MIAMAADGLCYTTGEAARLIGCPEWRVGRLYVRGVLPEPRRHAGARLLTPDDVELVRAALVEQGVIPVSGGGDETCEGA